MNIKRWTSNKTGQVIKFRKMQIGGVCMAILAKGKPIMFNIKQEMAKEFIEESNKKVISKSFIEECKKASELFRKRT